MRDQRKEGILAVQLVSRPGIGKGACLPLTPLQPPLLPNTCPSLTGLSFRLCCQARLRPNINKGAQSTSLSRANHGPGSGWEAAQGPGSTTISKAAKGQGIGVGPYFSARTESRATGAHSPGRCVVAASSRSGVAGPGALNVPPKLGEEKEVTSDTSATTGTTKSRERAPWPGRGRPPSRGQS